MIRTSDADAAGRGSKWVDDEFFAGHEFADDEFADDEFYGSDELE